ncbi:MAG: helix-turn-helix transcriptional regulator [Muribaculaceae bacterium]|nr:helix-turn-helix transcriptional regulator [Muribaculaceae bacterium]
MDIAGRLRHFMTEKGIASSQFADTADIPRPTLSQLLNGRNKKISNELISKIHIAYPALNVLWLMFGEGEMEHGSNIEFSATQNAASPSPVAAQEPVYETVFIAQSPDYDSLGRSSNQRSDVRKTQSAVSRAVQPERSISDEAMQALSKAGARVNENARVQQIMVLYTDGRFETFKPAEQ